MYLSCHILAQSYFNMPLLQLIATKKLTANDYDVRQVQAPVAVPPIDTTASAHR
jgi:hypothetical protein